MRLLFAYVNVKEKRKNRNTYMSFNRPKIIPQTNDHHSAVLNVPQGKMHSTMPGLRVENAGGSGGRDQGGRPRFSKHKRSNPSHGLSPLTRTDRHYGGGDDFPQQQQQQQAKRSMLPPRGGQQHTLGGPHCPRRPRRPIPIPWSLREG